MDPRRGRGLAERGTLLAGDDGLLYSFPIDWTYPLASFGHCSGPFAVSVNLFAPGFSVPSAIFGIVRLPSDRCWVLFSLHYPHRAAP
jgi:hypothetical protein